MAETQDKSRTFHYSQLQSINSEYSNQTRTFNCILNEMLEEIVELYDNTIISMKDVKYCKVQGHALSPLSCATPDTL